MTSPRKTTRRSVLSSGAPNDAKLDAGKERNRDGAAPLLLPSAKPAAPVHKGKVKPMRKKA